ncbi:MAG: TIM barrel protein [Bacilli bacterium]|nr:TIM barrel protein [Bacilli bacterium]
MISVINDEISSNIIEVIETLNKVNLKLIELRKIDNNYLFQIDSSKLLEYKMELDKNNIKVSLIDSPIGKGKFNHEKEEELLDKYIKIAKVFNTKYLRIFTDISEDINEGLKKYNHKAKENNIILLIENEPNTYGEDYNNLLNLMSNNYSNIRLLYDVENYYSIKLDYIKAFSLLKPYIKYIHLRDKKYNDYVYFFDGEIEIKKILSLIDDDIIVSLETHLPLSSNLDKKELFIESLRRIRNE